MTVDSALLGAVVAFLLPLRLLSFALRLASDGRGTNTRHLRRSCATLAVAAALLAVIFALPRDHAGECAAPVGAVSSGRDRDGGFPEEQWSEVEQLKLKVARLESLWDNNPRALDEKSGALDEDDGRVMRAMGLDIQSLINEQENIKIQESLCSSYFDNSIKAMNNEVQILKDESRKMNSDLWSVAKDTTEKVKALHEDIKQVQVITDEWVKMNFSINRIWSFVKDTEKRVEGLYSDFKEFAYQRMNF
ncbi:hypothetical protein U9M48_024770 [Paspalum notatum var. saurae]|uniref:Uncharacterized protein n=1 Tax=Paspalum notatum var. saurae TaxID=547442 RepID=A0AAQ3WXI5_PASNO